MLLSKKERSQWNKKLFTTLKSQSYPLVAISKGICLFESYSTPSPPTVPQLRMTHSVRHALLWGSYLPSCPRGWVLSSGTLQQQHIIAAGLCQSLAPDRTRINSLALEESSVESEGSCSEWGLQAMVETVHCAYTWLWKISFGYWTTVSEVDLHPVTELNHGSLIGITQQCVIMDMNVILFMVMYSKYVHNIRNMQYPPLHIGYHSTHWLLF
jgi:hypothetical protein